MKRICVVVPLYNESKNVRAMHQALRAALDARPGLELRFLFVDDGSLDSTSSEVEAAAATDPRVGLVQLSRNFGKEVALSAGIAHADPASDAVVLMDGDLQHPPAVIPALIAEWERGFEIVTARRTGTERKPLLRTLGSKGFHWLFSSITDLDMVAGSTDFRLLDRTVVAELRRFTERNRLVRGLIDWLGFRRGQVEFTAPGRVAGEPGYSYAKLVQLAMRSFTSFSLFPLKIAGFLGISISTAFGGLLAVMIADKLSWNRWNFSPLAFVVVTNALLVGIILICLGLIALYVGSIHGEVQNRPLFVVRRRTGAPFDGPSR